MVPGDEDEEHGQCGLPLKEQQIVHRVRPSIYSDIAWDCLRLQSSHKNLNQPLRGILG